MKKVIIVLIAMLVATGMVFAQAATETAAAASASGILASGIPS